MSRHPDPYGEWPRVVTFEGTTFVWTNERREEQQIRLVRARMEASREAQSEAWEVICRIAGRDIDFELDDLVALEARAQAEFDRTRAEARAAEEARAVEEARAADLPYEDLRTEIARVWREFAMGQHIISCPICRKKGGWRRSNIDEETKPWTDLKCPICFLSARRGIIDPCFHSLCWKCRLCAPPPDMSFTRAEAIILALGRNPEYIKWVKKNPK